MVRAATGRATRRRRAIRAARPAVATRGGTPGGGNARWRQPAQRSAPRTSRRGRLQAWIPGPSPLRLLTRAEYVNTVRDLFGRHAQRRRRPARGRPAGARLRQRRLRALGLGRDGRPASSRRPRSWPPPRWPTSPKLAGCDPAKAGEPACLNKFLDGFAKRAWRRPLTAAERQNLTTAFNDGKANGKAKSFAEGLEAALTVLLISPQFLYRYEQGIPITGNASSRS